MGFTKEENVLVLAAIRPIRTETNISIQETRPFGWIWVSFGVNFNLQERFTQNGVVGLEMRAASFSFRVSFHSYTNGNGRTADEQ